MDHVTTFLQSKLILGQSAAADASSGLVSASDFQAILPALVFIATGTLLLMLDCFSRGLSHTNKPEKDRSSLSTAINFIGLLGTVVAGAFACASMEQAEPSFAFQNYIRVDTYSSAVSLIIILGTFFSLLAAIDRVSTARKSMMRLLACTKRSIEAAA